MLEHIKVVNQNYHMQGFTSGGGFVYFSFTDSLVKTTPAGTVKCQAEVFGGHLGDIDYYDGKIYGSYLGNALPGHAWDDWTCFKIYVFDASDLRVLNVINMDICDEYKRISGTPADTRGFSGIDGVAFGREPGHRRAENVRRLRDDHPARSTRIRFSCNARRRGSMKRNTISAPATPFTASRTSIMTNPAGSSGSPPTGRARPISRRRRFIASARSLTG